MSYYSHGPGEIVKLAANQQQQPLDNSIGHLVFQLDRSSCITRCRLPSLAPCRTAEHHENG